MHHVFGSHYQTSAELMYIIPRRNYYYLATLLISSVHLGVIQLELVNIFSLFISLTLTMLWLPQMERCLLPGVHFPKPTVLALLELAAVVNYFLNLLDNISSN